MKTTKKKLHCTECHPIQQQSSNLLEKTTDAVIKAAKTGDLVMVSDSLGFLLLFVWDGRQLLGRDIGNFFGVTLGVKTMNHD